MNLEQRERVYRSIQKLEGLLASAVRHGETAEAERIEMFTANMKDKYVDEFLSIVETNEGQEPVNMSQ